MSGRLIEILGLRGRRRIEILFPTRKPRAATPRGLRPSGPTTTLYHWTLARLGLRSTITSLLRRWQYSEPLLWLLAVAVASAFLGHTGDARNLLWLGAGVLIGLLSAHLFWSRT